MTEIFAPTNVNAIRILALFFWWKNIHKHTRERERNSNTKVHYKL